MSRKTVYLDNAATTPVRPEVREAMLPYLGGELFGNPSSSHRQGRAARAGLEEARQQVARAVDGTPGQVFFTSGGTEADNWAVLGGAMAARTRGQPMRVAIPGTEHKAVLAAAHAVAALGGEEIVLPVAPDGTVSEETVAGVLQRKVALLSVMWVNNETGVIQNVSALSRLAGTTGTLFHTDAVQAFGKIPLSFRQLGVDALTVSGHKIGAPKGIGALIVRDPGRFAPLILGGSQQGGHRPGTENIAGAVGLGVAATLAATEQAEEARRLSRLRDQLERALLATVPGLVVTARQVPRGPQILHVMIPGTDSEALLMHLDLAGIACSSGSACTTGSVEPSHVLMAMGLPRELGVGAIRFSLGRDTTEADISQVVVTVPAVVEKVQKLAGVLGRG